MNPHLRIYRGFTDIQGLSAGWQSLQHHPNSDYDHFMLVCRLRSEVIAPFALGFLEDGTCRAIMAGRLEQQVLRPSVGYAKLPGLRANVLTFIHEGILGELDSRMAAAAIEALSAIMVSREIDAVNFHMLPERVSSLWDVLQNQSAHNCGAVFSDWAIHRDMRVESEPGYLLRRMRSKHRAWIRRKERDLERTFPGLVAWKWCTGSIDVPELCDKMEAVARTTYQRGLGAGFVDNGENRERLALFARNNQLRVLLLEIAGNPKAFWMGNVYKGAFHSAATGYTPDVRDFEVGTLTFIRMVDELVREGVTRLDFGLGDAHYKERFGDRHWREASVQLFGPTPKGRFLHAYLGMFRRFDREARRLLSRLGAVDRIKRSWRDRLRG